MMKMLWFKWCGTEARTDIQIHDICYFKINEIKSKKSKKEFQDSWPQILEIKVKPLCQTKYRRNFKWSKDAYTHPNNNKKQGITDNYYRRACFYILNWEGVSKQITKSEDKKMTDKNKSKLKTSMQKGNINKVKKLTVWEKIFAMHIKGKE